MMGIKRAEVARFTTAEQLIVVAVLAIIAALVILNWSQIQWQTKLSVAKNDMAHIAEATKIFKVNYARAPIDAVDFSQIMQDAKVYDSTRTPAKSYAICADGNGYAFVAWNPIATEYKNGNLLYMYSSGGSQQLYQVTDSSLSANDQLDKICAQVYSTYSFDSWTYNLP